VAADGHARGARASQPTALQVADPNVQTVAGVPKVGAGAGAPKAGVEAGVPNVGTTAGVQNVGAATGVVNVGAAAGKPTVGAATGAPERRHRRGRANGGRCAPLVKAQCRGSSEFLSVSFAAASISACHWQMHVRQHRSMECCRFRCFFY